MSFYDLTKDQVLSASQLFKHRLKQKPTIPSKGGQKYFEPDGSWLQNKALEAFKSERLKILEEQRFDKVKNLIQGVWDIEKQLVNIDKTGKFWSHMGFTDDRRNWLYPEEALFLMETSNLEILSEGVPLSIQEAFDLFLGSSVSLEEYQVFAHLRRLGYVVLRHEKNPEVTPYERQLNLDKYVTKKSLKERREKAVQKKKGVEEAESDDDQQSDDKEISQSPKSTNPGSDEHTTHLKRLRDDEENGNEKSGKKLKTESAVASMEEDSKIDSDEADQKSCSNVSEPWYSVEEWGHCFQESSSCSLSKNISNETPQTASNLESAESSDSSGDVSLPNIADQSTVTLVQPKPSFLPEHVMSKEKEANDLIFDVSKYRLQNPTVKESRNNQRQDEKADRQRNLLFSHADWTQQRPHISASNWTEYKQKKREILQNLAASTPVDHFWKGEVTPLVNPEDAISKETLQARLSIIQSVENSSLVPESDCVIEHKISYDVHLPDSRFKKSLPGIPNHRVCVVKCSDAPPGLTEIQLTWARFKDDVPLHWAVVDSGEIAFYLFDNTFSIETLST